MSTRRERQQLGKRSRRARRRTKPDQQQQAPEQDPQDHHIGYFAREGREVLRHDDGAVVIIGSRPVMQQVLKRRGRTTMTICDVTFWEITHGLVEGAAFCFDDQAYARLLEPAREAGLPLKEYPPGGADSAGTPTVGLQLDFGAARPD